MDRYELEIIKPVMYAGRFRKKGDILQGVPRGPAQNLIHREKAVPVIKNKPISNSEKHPKNDESEIGSIS